MTEWTSPSWQWVEGVCPDGSSGSSRGQPLPLLTSGGSSEVLPDPREVLQNRLGGSAVLLTCNLRCQSSVIKKCFEFKQRKTLPFLGGGWPRLKLGGKLRLWSQETGTKLSSPSLCTTSVIASELPSSPDGAGSSGFSCSKIFLPDCMKAPDPFQHKVKQVNAGKEFKIQGFVWLCRSCLSQLTPLSVTQGNWVYVQTGTRN